MSSRVYFLKNGFIVRSSSSSTLQRKKDERPLIIDDEVAKNLRWVPKEFDPKNTKTLYSHPVGFPYSRIGEENILDPDSYVEPPLTTNHYETKDSYLLSKILEGLKGSIPYDLQEYYALLQIALQEKTQLEDFWGRLVYTDGDLTITEGSGFSASILNEGEVKITFENSFIDSSAYSLWASFETDGVSHYFEHLNGEECILYLKDVEGNPLTDSTFSILVRGRLK